MAVSVEDLTKDSFKICLREVKIIDGLNKGIKIVSKNLYLTGVSAKTSVTDIRSSESCIMMLYVMHHAPCTMMAYATQEDYWLKSFKTRAAKQTFLKICFIYTKCIKQFAFHNTLRF